MQRPGSTEAAGRRTRRLDGDDPGTPIPGKLLGTRQLLPEPRVRKVGAVPGDSRCQTEVAVGDHRPRSPIELGQPPEQGPGLVRKITQVDARSGARPRDRGPGIDRTTLRGWISVEG